MAESRVKKYEALRQEMQEGNDKIEEPKLSRFAKRLSNIDSEYFTPIVENVQNDLYKDVVEPRRSIMSPFGEELDNQAKERNTFEKEEDILERAQRIAENNAKSDNGEELLNSFLKEIRTYNQQQGVRSMDDTSVEILKKVKMDNTESSEIVEQNEDKKLNDEETKASISQHFKKLLSIEPEYEEHTEDDITEKEEERTKQDYAVASTVEPNKESNTDKYEKLINEDRKNQARILEETQQLRLKISEHDDELDEIGTGIDNTKRLLNVLLGLLLCTVLIAGGILAWLIFRG